ncbi:MAG: DUF2797 domain-containing protein [Candidatus Bathyarchaeia archaeon]
MTARLALAIRWVKDGEAWRCQVLFGGEEESRLSLERGGNIFLRILNGRFCTGYSRLVKEKGDLDTWKERVQCPSASIVDSGTQCRECQQRDISAPCARCDGSRCLARPELKLACERDMAYVYIASFGGGRLKAGVSHGGRVERRWVEQGADAARRVLIGNGMDVRRFENRIQGELGALRRLRPEEKMDLKPSRDPLDGLRLLDEYEEKIHEAFPKANHFHEETRVLLPIYNLPVISTRPVELRVRDGVEISGRILGVKGPVLFVEKNRLIFSVSLHRLVGRRIEVGATQSTVAQSGLRLFIDEGP